MLYGNRVSGQYTCARGDGPSSGNSFAFTGYQFAQGQVGFYTGCTRRALIEKLEEFALRKDGGRRTIHTNKQAVSSDFHHRHGEQAEQDDGSQSVESRLARGKL